MIVQLAHLKRLFESEGISTVRLNVSDTSTTGGLSLSGDRIEYHDTLDQAQINMLLSRHVQTVDVMVDKDILAKLRKLFPGEYDPAQY
ncbi:MAG: hypothetical protein GF311_27535, partial [Candidatus Lokiarchaeota archaeon]|nr:hypothetical protein [Candidatus Lokiarchaeota archaeon]